MSATPVPTLEGTTAWVADRYFVSLTAWGSITAGQAVSVISDWLGAVTSGGQDSFVGLALTGPASGSRVDVVTRGQARATAGSAINAGQLISSASGGNVAAVTVQQYSGSNTYSNFPRGLAISTATGLGSSVYVVLF